MIVIGGGAAGFFAAINLAKREPATLVVLLEKSNKLLSKVKISGGGRCNVTHHCFDNRELVNHYPRGRKELLQVFSKFSVQDTIHWFKSEGIALHTEADGRMFPSTNSSQTIIDCFLQLAEKLRIKVITSCEVNRIELHGNTFELKTSLGTYPCDSVICALGGHPNPQTYQLLKDLGHTVIAPLPSLFTINLPEEKIKKELQGISVQNAGIQLAGTKIKYNGPLLITHWGLSGPAVLKLSAFAAEEFYRLNYQATIQVNWAYPHSLQETEEALKSWQKDKPKTFPANYPMFDLPKRLWEFLCQESGIPPSKPWAEIGMVYLRKLASMVHNSTFAMKGKTTFKEEFVTCGGIHLKEIDFKTMESKVVKGLYFCGEVLNIDGVTGGFNFQNAWSTAWICAQNA